MNHIYFTVLKVGGKPDNFPSEKLEEVNFHIFFFILGSLSKTRILDEINTPEIYEFRDGKEFVFKKDFTKMNIRRILELWFHVVYLV